jgi:hypothetical protein
MSNYVHDVEAYVLTHNGRRWTIERDSHGHWFACDDMHGRIGPYSTVAEAVAWIREIRP